MSNEKSSRKIPQTGSFIKNTNLKTRKMVQWLKEDPASIPSPYVVISTIYNSNSK